MYSKDSIYKVYRRGISKDIPNRDEVLRYWKEGFGDLIAEISMKTSLRVKKLNMSRDLTGIITFQIEKIRPEPEIPLNKAIHYICIKMDRHGIPVNRGSITSTNTTITIPFS